MELIDIDRDPRIPEVYTLQGGDYAKVGSLNYCAEAGLGEGDLKKVEIVGEPIVRHVKSYKLAPNIEQQLIWMKPLQRAWQAFACR